MRRISGRVGKPLNWEGKMKNNPTSQFGRDLVASRRAAFSSHSSTDALLRRQDARVFCESGIRGRVRLNEPLKYHTTFKLGGPAKFFIEPKDIRDLKVLLKSAKRCNMPLLVIGAGSNILPSDCGVDAIVMRLGSPYFKKLSFEDRKIMAGAGCLLNRIVNEAKRHGLSGAEFLTGIPGTIGGALAMNAGQGKAGKWIGDLVGDVTVMDYNGDIKTLSKKEIKFGYRFSNLTRYIILGASLILDRKNKKEIQAQIKQNRDFRKVTQDVSFPNAGCVFKNPRQYPAAKLIDLCGLKGKRIGGACVSPKHANFILNSDNAQATEVLKLINFIRNKVRQKFHIDLKPEIKIWG